MAWALQIGAAVAGESLGPQAAVAASLDLWTPGCHTLTTAAARIA